MKNDKSTQPLSDEAVPDLAMKKKTNKKKRNLTDQRVETPANSTDVIAELFERYRPFIDRLEKLLKQGA
jgi:hypothetical protein